MNPEQPIPFDVVMETVNAHIKVTARAAHVAALAGFNCHEVFFNEGESITIDDNAAIMVFTWNEFTGYDSEPEPHCEHLPLRYLWTPNAEIIAEVAEQKRAREQAERAKEIKALEREVQEYREMLAKLPEKEERLAKLKEQA